MFTLTGTPPWLSVLNPSTPANWELGSTHTIEWQLDNEYSSQEINILLYRDSKYLFTVNNQYGIGSGPIPPEVSSLAWKIPNELQESSQYKLHFQQIGQQVSNGSKIIASSSFSLVENHATLSNNGFTNGVIFVIIFYCAVALLAYISSKMTQSGKLFQIWARILFLECIDLGLIMWGWSAMVPTLPICDRLMISATAIQSFQLAIVAFTLILIETFSEDERKKMLKCAHWSCVGLDAIEGLLYGFATDSCPNTSSTMVYIGLVVLVLGEVWQLTSLQTFVRKKYSAIKK